MVELEGSLKIKEAQNGWVGKVLKEAQNELDWKGPGRSKKHKMDWL